MARQQEKLKAYRKELIERLNACTQRPQETLEYWMNEDDIHFLRSIQVLVDSDGSR